MRPSIFILPILSLIFCGPAFLMSHDDVRSESGLSAKPSKKKRRAYVKNACSACRQGHHRCENVYPCKRCIGIAGTKKEAGRICEPLQMRGKNKKRKINYRILPPEEFAP